MWWGYGWKISILWGFTEKSDFYGGGGGPIPSALTQRNPDPTHQPSLQIHTVSFLENEIMLTENFFSSNVWHNFAENQKISKCKNDKTWKN